MRCFWAWTDSCERSRTGHRNRHSQPTVTSTTEQNLDLQLTALDAGGAARIFADNGVSGSTTERPQLSKALDRLEIGDVLTVWKLDRLGRNTRHVLDVIETVREQGAGFRSLTEGLDTTGPMGTAMLTIMAAFAQLERDTMIERTRAGLVVAAANNHHGGRPRKVDDAAAARAMELKGKGVSAPDIGKMLGVSRATFYRYLILATFRRRAETSGNPATAWPNGGAKGRRKLAGPGGA
ncbi:recombinase family protein [Arthrobacter sp. UYCu712]|uniref:recombinase family protein n=1 Tax=Arthrobacter sp. UYCu712 TaxID=3156340 RepID=UPI0033949246